MTHPIYRAAAEHHVSDPELIDAAVLAYDSLTEGHLPDDAATDYVADVVILLARAAGASTTAHLSNIPHVLKLADTAPSVQAAARALTAERFSGTTRPRRGDVGHRSTL